MRVIKPPPHSGVYLPLVVTRCSDSETLSDVARRPGITHTKTLTNTHVREIRGSETLEIAPTFEIRPKTSSPLTTRCLKQNF